MDQTDLQVPQVKVDLQVLQEMVRQVRAVHQGLEDLQVHLVQAVLQG
jgi:hypothetical protein